MGAGAMADGEQGEAQPAEGAEPRPDLTPPRPRRAKGKASPRAKLPGAKARGVEARGVEIPDLKVRNLKTPNVEPRAPKPHAPGPPATKAPAAKASGSKPAIKSLGTALTLAARFHRARSAEHLSALDLHPGQDRALQAMAHEGAMTMGALALQLQIRPPTASKMIARLGQQGLVERRAAGGDARLVEVALTPEGMERAAALDGLARTVDEEMTRGLDAKERKRLRKLLRRVVKNLAKATGIEAGSFGAAPGEEDEA